MNLAPDSELPTSSSDVVHRWRRAFPIWLHFALMLVVFVAGAVSGAMFATNQMRLRMERFRHEPTELVQHILPRLQNNLDLTASQSAAISAVIQEYHPRIVKCRQQSIVDMHHQFDEMESQVAALLNADQRPRWERTANNVRSRFLPR
ncbi:MAG: hypothetical protein R3C28_08035 [Pirellulaceae bacterium]